MKKNLKRIFALLIVIILAALYIGTLLLAIFGNENTLSMLKAAIYSTIVLPVLLWAYTFIYRLLKKHYGVDSDIESEDESSKK